jgi:hypothetical protein
MHLGVLDFPGRLSAPIGRAIFWPVDATRRRFAWKPSQQPPLPYLPAPDDRDGSAKMLSGLLVRRALNLVQSVMARILTARRPRLFLLSLARAFQRARRRAGRSDTVFAPDARSHALLKICRVVRWK